MCQILYIVYTCAHRSRDYPHPCSSLPLPLPLPLPFPLRPTTTLTPQETLSACANYDGRAGVWVSYACGRCWVIFWLATLQVLGPEIAIEGVEGVEEAIAAAVEEEVAEGDEEEEEGEEEGGKAVPK